MYKLLHENKNFIIVDKAPGVLSIQDRYDKDKPNLKTALQDKFGAIYTVHRLDRDTSGLICFAKSPEAHAELNKQFQENEVDKTYQLIVHGRVFPESFIIDKPIKPHEKIKGKMISSLKGKPSITEFKKLEQFRNFCILEAKPKTGRTHQIRVHISGYGFPIVADKVYSSSSSIRLSDFNSKIKEETRPIISRQALHAAELSFKDISNNKKVTFSSELPKDMSVLLKILRKYNS